ncbi:extracellular solute-binding protein [Fibrobacter sp.]|uniref:extracellular solute-binding protein n=1 Tax=Fibrobacter sp. TaxID=35828 RepID=UPI0025B8FD9F|nr:extracellular solute-binding protein [Fibrobacter sp.]
MPNGASPQQKLEQELEVFTAKTHIPVKVKVLDWGEAWNRISNTLETGEDTPDVLQLGSTWVPYFAARGVLKNLNEYIDQIDSTRFVPVSWYTSHIDADTNIYAIPWFIDARPVLGNKRIMKKYGITPQSMRDYKGFSEAIRKVNEGKELLDYGAKIRGYAFPGKSDWNIPHNFAPWIWSYGGRFVEKDENGKWHSQILTAPTLEGIAKYLSFIVDSLVSTESLQSNSAEIAQQFNNGEFAFIVSTAEIVMQTRIHGSQGGLSDARIGQDSVTVLPIPRGTAGSVSFLGGSDLAIPAKSTKKEAIQLLLFLTEDASLDDYTKQIGFLPASKKVLESWAEDETYKDLVALLATGRTYPALPEWGTIEQTLVSMFSAVWELLEIPALYSEEKLYRIFKEKSDIIDAQLGYTPTHAMTFAEFQEIWKNSIVTTNTAKQETDQEKKPESKGINPTPYVFFVVLILGFIFSYTRKRKKR